LGHVARWGRPLVQLGLSEWRVDLLRKLKPSLLHEGMAISILKSPIPTMHFSTPLFCFYAMHPKGLGSTLEMKLK
jgi:hypothetical protein